MTNRPAEKDEFSRCLVLNTIKAARALSRHYDARLKPYGVTVIQFSVMALIRRNPGETINALAERIAMDRSTLTRNIDVLARNGMVVKDNAARGNAKTCRLTELGESRLDEIIPQWRAAQTELREMIGGEDPDAFLSVLHILSRK
jgi:DNA-binding MarR family transcriptional regulator